MIETLEFAQTDAVQADGVRPPPRRPVSDQPGEGMAEDRTTVDREVRSPQRLRDGRASSTAAERMQRSTQLWSSLTPIVSVALTAITFLLTFLFQVHQEGRTAEEKEDTEWRATLQNLSMEDKSLVPGALGLQSFFSSPRYGHQARSLTSLLLPRLADTATFDIIFFDMADHTRKEDEEDLLSIDRATATDLRTLYDRAMINSPASGIPDDASFRNFLKNPAVFLRDPAQTQDLKAALADDWKLESVSAGLKSIWQGERHKDSLTPGRLDLTGIVFVNADFNGAGLTKAQIEDAEFDGTCKTSSGQSVDCAAPTH